MQQVAKLVNVVAVALVGHLQREYGSLLHRTGFTASNLPTSFALWRHCSSVQGIHAACSRYTRPGSSPAGSSYRSSRTSQRAAAVYTQRLQKTQRD
jgi:hypothetical protein